MLEYLVFDSKNQKLPKIIKKNNYLKVLELSECRRGDPYMTANKNSTEGGIEHPPRGLRGGFNLVPVRET